MGNTSISKKGFSQDSKQAFRNPWVVGWIAAILLVIAVNTAFIVTAVVTNPGLVEQDYYEKGKDHEKNFLAKRAMRNRLGWEMSLEPVAKPVINEPIRFTFNIVDQAGVPVQGEEAIMQAYRPSDASADFQTAMAEVAPGVYSVETGFPLKGIWDITATLVKGEDSLKVTRRISVAAQ